MNSIAVPITYAAEALFDFGLVILILIVQIIIYPSFRFYELDRLKKIHSRYTRSITMMVMPLMILQIAMKIYMLWTKLYWLESIALLIVLIIWFITFRYAVPIHNDIQKASSSMVFSQDLVKINSYRTLLWCCIFLLTLFKIFI